MKRKGGYYIRRNWDSHIATHNNHERDAAKNIINKEL